MARDYGRIMVSVWDDPDYQELGLELQGLYCALLAYPKVSWCGVIDYIPKRLVRIDPALSERTLWEKLAQLHNHKRMIQIDTATDELLIRTFIKHDGIMKQPNVAKAMSKAFYDMESEPLQNIVLGELAKHYLEAPDLGGWKALEDGTGGFTELYWQVVDRASDIPSLNPSGNPSANPSANPSGTLVNGRGPA